MKCNRKIRLFLENMLLQHFRRIPELLFIFDKISLPQYVYTASKSFRQNPHSTFYYHNKKSHIRSQKSLVTVCSLFNHPRSRYYDPYRNLHLIIQQNLLHPEAPYKYPAWKHHDLGSKLHGILPGIPLLLIHRHMLRNGISSQEARFSASISLRLLPSITRTHSPSGFSSL